MEQELIKNIEEFLESGKDNLEKERFNAAASDFFKAIVVLCDLHIYKNIKSTPKNHNERFLLLKKYFLDIYEKVSSLFEIYTKSYNLRLNKKDAVKLENYAYELRDKILKNQIK